MNAIFEQIRQIGIVPVIQINDAEKAVDLAHALLAGGIPIAEVTFRTAAGEEAIRRIAREAPEVLVGAGTVLRVAQAESAVAAGAKFIVSPGFSCDVVRYCVENNIPVLPGCSNPSDIQRAIAHHLDVVKFFPAEQAGGLPYIKAVAAAYPQVRFVPTGGISEKNLAAYLANEKILACGGSWMVPAKLIDSGAFETITELCAKAIQAKKSVQISKVIPKPIKMPRVVTFGELMLRLAPEGYLRFVQADRFQATFGGAEANVAVDLACLGANTAFVTKLPAHEIGQLAVNSLRKFGVDTSHIVRGGARVGVYYVEKGASQRASKVIYDRAGAAIAEADCGEFDWDTIFDGADWFHFTGITPALSKNAAALCLEACKAAVAHGVPVSCDLNYRKNLWSTAAAKETMTALMPYVSLCIANEEDAADVFGIHAEGSDAASGKLSAAGYADVARQLSERFNIPTIAITLRQSITANDNIWAAMLYTDGKPYVSSEYPVHIVDRVGGGDSFGAGLIFATLQGDHPQERLEFAVAASCLKHAIEGDYNPVSVDEVRRLAGGNTTGRVMR